MLQMGMNRGIFKMLFYAKYLNCLFIGKLYFRLNIYLQKTRLSEKIEPWHEISKNVVCATSKGSDQPAHTRSLIRAFASSLNILLL